MDGIRPNKPNKTELDRIIPSGPNWTKKGCFCFSYKRILRGCLVFKKPNTPHSFNFYHSSLYNSSLKIPQFPKVACLTLISNFDNSKNFTFCGTHGLTWCSFYFLFLFSFNPQYPNSPNLVKRNEKKETKPRNPM